MVFARNCGLLALPRELRDKIYDLVFETYHWRCRMDSDIVYNTIAGVTNSSIGPCKDHCCHVNPAAFNMSHDCTVHKSPSPEKHEFALLYVCHQITWEVLLVLAKQTVVHLRPYFVRLTGVVHEVEVCPRLAALCGAFKTLHLYFQISTWDRNGYEDEEWSLATVPKPYKDFFSTLRLDRMSVHLTQDASWVRQTFEEKELDLISSLVKDVECKSDVVVFKTDWQNFSKYTKELYLRYRG